LAASKLTKQYKLKATFSCVNTCENVAFLMEQRKILTINPWHGEHSAVMLFYFEKTEGEHSNEQHAARLYSDYVYNHTDKQEFNEKAFDCEQAS